MAEKAASAFRTIGELSQEIGVRQHILRYWETRFPQLKPLQRAGGRRYYRPEDVALVRRIHALLSQEGYTIRGVQAVLKRDRATRGAIATGVDNAASTTPEPAVETVADQGLFALQAIRDQLAQALIAARI